ncbi:MAG: tRNA pseudouridine(55) synthase TruB [Sterolibacterium sp.]|nr:tRNA pseudouridine(55) synthase TruB [Sterolibacterium sp.]
MSAPRRAPRCRVDGVLLLDKPLGLTSNAALQTVKRLYNAAKAGHTGTLDPLATGLLPLCFGEATKFAGELLEADKEYVAQIRLGVTTTTADSEGDVLSTSVVAVDAAQVGAVLAGFVGESMQVPPMYSALKRDGKALYEYARQGIEVERKARRVVIHDLRMDAFDNDLLVITVACSKGTYIRTLAEDIGAQLGCGAHLAGLRRTRIGRLELAQAVSLEQIEAATGSARDALLAPVDALLDDLPCAELDESGAFRLGKGQAVRWNGPPGRWRAYCGERFLGVCLLDAEGWLQPRRLIAETRATRAEADTDVVVSRNDFAT